MNEIRLMLLRDEMEEVVERITLSRDDLRCLAMLLEDPGAGVPVLAADAFRLAAIRGQDIRECEGELLKALGDKYARRNAAGALAAHYRSIGQDSKADDLLGSPDMEISGGALEALGGMGDA